MASSNNITATQLRQLLHYDQTTGVFTRMVATSANSRIGEIAGSLHAATGYVHLSLCGRKYLAHRLAWLYMTGKWPKNQIDHINRNRADNRWSNLRSATNSENQRNSFVRSTNKSGEKGVIWHKRRRVWVVYIGVNGNNKYIGQFKAKQDAVFARRIAALEIHGEFARFK